MTLNEHLVRQDVGAKHDAERDRKGDVILDLLFEESAGGHLYTTMQFAEAFENQSGLGSKYTIRERLSVLATKGHVKFLRDGSAFGYPKVRSRFGYLCVDGMRFRPEERVDSETGEVFENADPVLPSHYKCPNSGVCMDVENPDAEPEPEVAESSTPEDERGDDDA